VKIFLYIVLCTLSPLTLLSQPNCEILKNDSACYLACKTAWKAIRYEQGSFKSQALFDKSIAQCSSFAYSHQQKAVAFLKRGQFIEWKKLIDKAVELSPTEYLGYRGWCRIQFLRDYYGAIKDLEQLKSLTKHDIGFCQNGNYHLEIALALCYKEVGQLAKAKEIFENYLSSANYNEGLYDYYHLGVIEFHQDNFTAAKESFMKQNQLNDIAESHYYLALIAEEENNDRAFALHLDKAEEQYRSGTSLEDNYAEPIDKIYLTDILNKRNNEAQR